MIPEERMINKIYLIRGQKVMLDSDLADLYGVETKRLKEQVRRNKDRFPDDFMFEMTREEFENWRTQFATSKSVIMGLRTGDLRSGTTFNCDRLSITSLFSY